LASAGRLEGRAHARPVIEQTFVETEGLFEVVDRFLQPAARRMGQGQKTPRQRGFGR
jgi:hypothetical protein